MNILKSIIIFIVKVLASIILVPMFMVIMPVYVPYAVFSNKSDSKTKKKK